MYRSIVFSALSGLVLAGCVCCAPPSDDQPALLENGDAETLAELKIALGEALGRAQIEFGPWDPSVDTSLSVLPPPLSGDEGASPVLPVIFDLKLDGDTCYAVRRDTNETVSLGSLKCRRP